MGNSDKGKIRDLAAALNKSEAEFARDLVAEFQGKIVLAAMSIYVYPNALRYWLAKETTITAPSPVTDAPAERGR